VLPFTTHRIHLAGTMYTAEAGVDPAVDVRTHTVVEACGGSLAGRSIVDLGCLEGGFALEFARLGAERVVGIEARSVSVRRCELARDLLGLEQAEFVQADIKDELPRHSDGFDVVFAAGILYHLSDPAGFLQLVRSACRGVALIDTHVADPDAITHECSEQVVTQSAGGHDYRGRLFGEYEPGLDTVEREGLLWAAWSDAASFWPFEDDLVRMLHDAGFSDVEKVERDTMRHPWQVDAVNRVLYVCRV
jgi:SAM-dependent methyltransferase